MVIYIFKTYKKFIVVIYKKDYLNLSEFSFSIIKFYQEIAFLTFHESQNISPLHVGPLQWLSMISYLYSLVSPFKGHNVTYRPLDKRAWLKKQFLIPQPKHMLQVLKITVSMRPFFWAPETNVKIDG